MRDNRLKVGIAGYGIVGKLRHKHIEDRNDITVIAVCDRNITDNIQSDNKRIRYYKDYESMLMKESLDVLIVCMTNDIATKVTIAGLQNGLHVLCEKPPGRFVSDIESVRKVELNYPDLKLMYGFNHRYHDSVQDAIEVVKSGELGNIINLRGVYGKSKLVTFNQDDWRTKRSISGGGVLLDQGIHMVDLMRLFAGEFKDIYSFISNKFWGFDVEDNAYALLKTEGGIIGMLHSSATQWRHKFSLEINLEKGSVILGGILTGSKSYGSETMTIVWANPNNDGGDPKRKKVHYNKDVSWEREIAVFCDSIINDKKIKYGGSLDALRTMELVHDIYTSDKAWSKKFNFT